MPIYEYECPACGVIEAWQGINEEPLKRCPHCKRRKVKKLISDSSFQLKGSGWYATDYGRSNGGNGKAKAEKKETAPKISENKDSAAKKSETASSSPSNSSTTSAS